MHAPPLHEITIDVRYHELDRSGAVKPVAILNCLQMAAAEHALLLGVGVADLLRRGYTWVLSRLHLEMERYPRSRELITIRTWPATRETIFSIREFELLDQAGERLGTATTSWAVLDLASRRPVRLDDVLPPYPLHAIRACEDSFETLPELTGASGGLTLPVLRDNLDINHHVNNTVYASWALEAIPSETADVCRLVSLEIGFRAEAGYGDSIVSQCRPVAGNDVWIHRIAHAGTGRELARVRSRWVPLCGT